MQTTKRQQYLDRMGIQSWQLRAKQQVESSTTNVTIDQDNDATWQQLQQRVTACTACALHCARTQTVFGVGNRQADLLVIGEAPGFHEDAKGEPFVGRAGKLLDSMLQAIHLDRSKVYIANILKCRPPNNRDPSPEEVATCTPFLTQQIKLINPKLILALGRIAAHFLLNTTTPLSKLRSQQFLYGEQQTPLLITYHPAYLLRSPRDKRSAWQDLQRVQQFL